jgi:hypothetical protein
MDVRLVSVLSLLVLVRRMGVLEKRMVVFVRVSRSQVLHFAARPAAAVVGHVYVLMVVDNATMFMRFERRHLRQPPR